jgi:ribosome biogenesis protein BMS1
MEDQANRPHRKSKEKKKHTGGMLYHPVAADEVRANLSTGPNPKAFGYANPGRLQKQAARSHDVRHAYYDTGRVHTDL